MIRPELLPLALVLRELGIKTIKLVDMRKIQNIIYQLQEAGLSLGYGFNDGIISKHSNQLAEDILEVMASGFYGIEGWSLKDKYAEMVRCLLK